ncbi:hypothetical protein BC833DRAFT_574721 [Globomyces pollinis-pini]|nr:hypothetical protein BC833DRAFT_574721 [Globomyces pollinis-pini]KAJ3000503.1 Nascent polypeptide-associated complex subunit beta [Globomyces sp. JEL0801]
MNPEKLAKLQAQVRIGGKGTPRRKVKKVQKTPGGEEKKLETTLKKLNVQHVGAVDEVNMFMKNQPTILNFRRPFVQASVASNTFCINGTGIMKDINQLLPGILAQFDDGSLAKLLSMQGGAPEEEGDDGIPDLVESENFEEVPELE